MGGDGVPRRELTLDQHDRLSRVLARVLAEHRARLVLLVESSGRPLVACGEYAQEDLDALASLAASALAASTRLAGALGEPEAALAIQRGGKELLHLVPNGESLLALALGSEPLRELERVRARLRLTRALAEVRSVLSGSVGEFASMDISDEEIESALAPIGAEDA